MCSPALTVLNSASLDLGGDALLQRFVDCGHDFAKLRREIQNEVVAPFETSPFVAAFAQGSVATKCAWLSLSPPRGSRYDPRRSQGVELGVRNLDAMVELFLKSPYPQWNRMRAIFDPANPTSDDLERVVTGATVLAEIMRSFGVTKFTVSTQGTRHGVALQLGQQLS